MGDIAELKTEGGWTGGALKNIKNIKTGVTRKSCDGKVRKGLNEVKSFEK
jgi:hypothetical protein